MAAMLLSFGACSEDKTDPDGPGPGPGPDPEPELSNKALITAFTAKAGDLTINGKIYDMEKKVELVCIPDQLEALKSATAEVTISDKATIAPDPATARDYTAGVEFTVTAEDGKTTKTYTVTAVEGIVELKAEKIWQKTFGEMNIGIHTVNDSGIAFSGDKFVAFDCTVHDMDGNKVGKLNTTGLPNEILVSMTNDENGILVASVANYNGNGTTTDDIVSGAIWAWKNGWDQAPEKLYENKEGNVTRFISIGGDITGDAILTVITPGRGPTAMHHCFVVKNGVWPIAGEGIWNVDGAGWNAFNTNYVSNDGNWSQQVSACSGDPVGTFIIFDSRSENKGAAIFARTGIAGTDTALNGTLWDDGIVAEADHVGTNQYGNYSNGHVRGFRINNTDYAIVSSTGWGAAYFTIQPADPSKDYLLRSQMFGNSTPYVSSAYRFNAAESCGEILCMSASFEIIRYKIVQELL